MELPAGRKRSKKASRPLADQRFSSYLTFGPQPTIAIATFLACYAVVMMAVWPFLSESLKAHKHMIPKAESVQDWHEAVERMKLPEKVKEEAEKLGEVTSKVKSQLQKLRHSHGTTDGELLQQAKEEFELLREKKNALRQTTQKVAKSAIQQAALSSARRGFVVLGMHRSGTSMLSGLLVTSCGYNVGAPLIGGAFDNEKGFFELLPAVLQNDEFLQNQQAYWAANVIKYDGDKGVEAKNNGDITFQQGKKALAFLNNPNNAPWLQKDPRMCITLKTWLKILNNEPAVVFTYRHPLEVALSLKKREKNFSLEHGLRLWIIYNMRAIQNSKGLCMVKSSNDIILKDPLTEVQRISDALTNDCGVPAPPRKVTQEDVDKFVDPKLQHNKNERAKEEQTKTVLKEYNGGSCKVFDYESDLEEGSAAHKREHKLYHLAMQVFCDFESGKAYDDNYEWPNLE